MSMKLAQELIEAARDLVMTSEDHQAASVWSKLTETEQRAVLDSDDPSFTMLRGQSRFDSATGERISSAYMLARPHWLDYPKSMGGQCWGPKAGAQNVLVCNLDYDTAIRLCYRVKAYGISKKGIVS